MRSLPLLTTVAAAGALAMAPAAGAATTLTIRGAGWGHGIGMSQYGAYGYAKAGSDYRSILGHYYTGTALGRLSDEPDVRVLLADGRGSIAVAGVSRVGDEPLDPGRTYTLVRGGDGVVLRQGRRTLFTGTPPMLLRAQVGGTILVGGARYRGALEISPSGRGLKAVGVVGLEDYVRGVVPRESPSSWPAEALKAQAVAARTYAITAASPGATLFPDTRSQVYGGASAETTSTNAAVAATEGEVVTYGGQPVVTYFFSTSGGRTENIENAWPGSTPRPWLQSVEDPYDSTSPYHRWKPVRMSAAAAKARLGALVRGAFKSIRVTRRGRSPRVVSAKVVGTRGTTVVSGPRLRTAFGLRDTWAYFTSVTTGAKRRPVTPPTADPAAPLPGSPSTGGT
ncbi:MAG TPA: SpoIID/LytB domain-containing protein, partial [Solirubrobacteraceae bacterium]|nr:SpoIID/LytB domain-containing protein [Solirubrobacteraceae bacterium]